MAEYTYTIEHVNHLRRECLRLGCLAPEPFWSADASVLRSCYNGIGPECWSSRLRDLVTRLLEPFEVAALIHDFEYVTAHRSYGAFTLANLRFGFNAILEARSLRSWRLFRLGVLLALLCQLFGWSAFRRATMGVG